jgi:serine/threonine-protein kinase
VEIYDFGVSDDSGFYYVMELLDGIDLETLVNRYGPLPPARVVHILRQVCESLGEAHAAGLIHRDIKPANIFLCRMGLQCDFSKLLDFGLVKTALAEGAERLAADGVTTGTPAYMAPELAIGSRELDGRVDLYCLGCVAYWLLTGDLVFSEKSAMVTIMAHAQQPPVPPSERTELPGPASLERVVMSCLAKRPEDRPASAGALARMLDECRDAGAWTQKDAAGWWQTNRPESRVQSAGYLSLAGKSTATLPHTV